MSRIWLLSWFAVGFLIPEALNAASSGNVQIVQSVVTLSNVSGAGSCTGGGCTGASVATIKQNQQRTSLSIDNSGGSVNVGYRFGTGTAAIGTAPTTTLAAGQLHFWPAGSAPTDAIVFISASATPAIAVNEGQ